MSFLFHLRSAGAAGPRRAALIPLTIFSFLVPTLELAAPAASSADSRNVTLLANVDDYPGYAACCAYVHSDGREYAALGTQGGTAIYRLTNPSVPVLVGFISGPVSAWREMKQYGDHLYVVSEGTSAGSGVQIIRMTNPDAPVLAATYTATFTTAHTVTVDTARGLLYANGASGPSGEMHILSLANPEAPVEIGQYGDRYAHDSHVRGNRLYVASIYEGLEVVLDVTNPAAPTEITSWQTPGAFTHNSWTSSDGNYLFTTDENPTGFLTVYDISALPQVTEVARWSANPEAIVHNVRVKGDTAFVSYYTEGVRLLDISDPTTPTEFGYYDTWPGASGGFNGDWDVDPFFPSGIFIVSDISTGLYVFRSNPQYGTVGGLVTDAASMDPLPGGTAEVRETGRTMNVSSEGRYRFALDPGSWTLDLTKFGYFPGTEPVVVTVGSSETRDVSLTKMPSGSLSGTITSAAGGAPVEHADIHLHETPLATSSGPSGSYSLPDVPEGTWQEEIHRAGYVAASRTVEISASQNTVMNVALQPMDFYDDADTDQGWTLGVPGDNAATGVWVRADPNGTGTPGNAPVRMVLDPKHEGGPSLHPEPGEGGSEAMGVIQPEDDNTPAPGTHCFITGNAPPGSGVAVNDVDGGITTLLSPVLNLSAAQDPHIALYYWYTNDGGQAPGLDSFVIRISGNGGTNWVTVFSTTESNHAWEYLEFRVGDFVAPTANMRVSFLAQDLDAGSVVEAGVDDFGWFSVQEQSAAPEGPVIQRPVSAAPNPFASSTVLRLSLPAPGALSVQVFDTAGRLVRKLYSGSATGAIEVPWDGRDDSGSEAPGGVYFVRSSGKGFDHVTRVVRVR